MYIAQTLRIFFIAILVLEKWGDTGRHVHADLIHILFFCEKQLLHSRRYNPRFTFFRPTFCPYLSLVFKSGYNAVLENLYCCLKLHWCSRKEISREGFRLILSLLQFNSASAGHFWSNLGTFIFGLY